MWTCPKCGEKIEDEFTSCWKCAGNPPVIAPAAKKRKPLELLELVFLMIAAWPGILLVIGGPVHNRAQGAYRISLFVIGLAGYIAVKIYQRRKPRGEN